MADLQTVLADWLGAEVAKTARTLPYGSGVDVRNGWNTHVVLVGAGNAVGFTDGPLLRTDYYGYEADCAVCGVTKQPVGRSAPMRFYYCTSDCPGYHQEPLPSNLWPDESESDFGYPVVR